METIAIGGCSGRDSSQVKKGTKQVVLKLLALVARWVAWNWSMGQIRPRDPGLPLPTPQLGPRIQCHCLLPVNQDWVLGPAAAPCWPPHWDWALAPSHLVLHAGIRCLIQHSGPRAPYLLENLAAEQWYSSPTARFPDPWGPMWAG